MNKRVFLLALLLTAALLLGACGDHAHPVQNTVEYARNRVGWRFSYTLDELTARMNRTIEDRNKDAKEPIAALSDWEILASGMADDSGTRYTTYSMTRNDGTLTAAVEDESRKLMNVGCGCLIRQLDDRAEKESFLTLAAILAVQAGGYSDSDIPFLQKLIKGLLEGEEDVLYYEGVLYSESRDDYTVVVILSPQSDYGADRDGVKHY